MRTLLIGDIHGDLDAVKATYTENADALIIQMGDFGFKDTYSDLPHYDSNRLKILGGNHDEYPALVNYPHYLGDFGTLQLGDKKAFFVRGAWSIDKAWRLTRKKTCWWEEEELTYDQCDECLALWKKECRDVDILLSHDTCTSGAAILIAAGGGMGNKKVFETRTGQLLEAMLRYHQPANWYHGHWHMRWTYEVGDCQVRSLGIDEVFELPSK